MAARKRKRKLPKTPGKKGDQTRRFRVRAHTRSPRGNDAGKPRVRVHPYRRGRPRRLPG
jgi:hypothetical protein